MWTRAQLKEKAKFCFHRNYWRCVLVAVIIGLITATGSAGGAANSANSTNNNYTDSRDFMNGFSDGFADGFDEDELLDDFEDSLDEDDSSDLTLSEEDEVVFALVFLGVFVIVFLIVFVIVMAIAIVLDAFVFNPLEVGSQRFFYTNLHQAAQVKEVAFAFDNCYKNVVKVMFFRDLYTFLWTLLFIIPGIVKSYEYRMIPYILAEHPDMPKEQAFAISKQMMYGEKWNAFVLDLSFIPWQLLSLITIGIVGVFYVDPYKNMTDAALYEALKYGSGHPYDGSWNPNIAPAGGFCNLLKYLSQT